MKSQIESNEIITLLCNGLIHDLYNNNYNKNQIKIIGIDGPTAAGKTIFADHLAKQLNLNNINCFVYRLDWLLKNRIDRISDLKNLIELDRNFKLEAEVHMRLEELEFFLKQISLYNDRIETNNSLSNYFEIKLNNLYSREDNGNLSGQITAKLSNGSVIIVEGHYTLRSELNKFFDLNILLLSDKVNLLARKISRVSGYRSLIEAETYFHTIDCPSFEHHLQRFGNNSTHIIQNNDYKNPHLVSIDHINKWCNQSLIKKENFKNNKSYLKIDINCLLENFFSSSLLIPNHYKYFCLLIFSNLYDLDVKISQKIIRSVDEISIGLSNDFQEFINNLNKLIAKNYSSQSIEIKFTNSLQNVYFRIFPLSLVIGITNDKNLFLLINFYEDKIEVCVVWRGGVLSLESRRSIGSDKKEQILDWSINDSFSNNFNSIFDEKITLLTPSSFMIPPFLQGENFFLKIFGREQENISSYECFKKLISGNLCWVSRFSLQREANLFSLLCTIAGAHSVVIGNYLIALKSNNRILNYKFKNFYKEWSHSVFDESKISKDVISYDDFVIRERDDISRINGNNDFIKVLDTHIFLKKSLSESVNLEDFLNIIRNLLLSGNRLLRKRVVQFINREFGIIQLPINKIWDSFDDNNDRISISDLILMQPTIMAELYLWMSIKRMPSAILGANVYDISKNSLDSYGHIKAAIDESKPIVLQASLNALGPKIDGGQRGYLHPQNGASDLINSIQFSLRLLYQKSGYTHPFYGIGLDHIDSRNDIPNGRARKFLENSVATGLITHIVLDGSSYFDAKESNRESLMEAYDKVAKYSATLVDGLENILLIDKEICGGELNYVGSSKLANIPEPAEIGIFVEKVKEHFRRNNLGSFLRRPILFIGNVGTTHHSGDIGDVKSEISGEWVDLVKKDLFVSAVLHGTTGTKTEILKRSLAGCKKINIAGDFLKTYIDALPKELQHNIYNLDPKEPKRALANFRKTIEALSQSDKVNVSESIYEHSRSVMNVINSPSLKEEEKNYFRYSPYIFSTKEADEIINEIRFIVSRNREIKTINSEKEKKQLSKFCASLIEVPFGSMFLEIASQLISAGINNFHIDVGDGKFITRKFSGLEKLKKLKEINKDIVTSVHLMVHDPHLSCEDGQNQNYIETYAKHGCSRIGIHLRSVSNHSEAARCFEKVRSHGSEPGIVIEVDEPFSNELSLVILQNKIEWLVIMGVRIGYGGQIFNTDVLQKIYAIRKFATSHKLNLCIEVDGGLTMNNIGACRNSGVDLFAGWSIIKPDNSMTLLDKLYMLKNRL